MKIEIIPDPAVLPTLSQIFNLYQKYQKEETTK